MDWRGCERCEDLGGEIFAHPTSANVACEDIEALFVGLGAEVSEREGSRVAIVLFHELRVFRRPRSSPKTGKGTVVSVKVSCCQPPSAGISLALQWFGACAASVPFNAGRLGVSLFVPWLAERQLPGSLPMLPFFGVLIFLALYSQPV